MAKRAANPKIRSILMQGTLVLVLGATVGLAALVTRQVRSSMRVELGEARTVGHLVVRLPAKWLSSPLVVEKGDGIEAEEPPGEQAGRRLRVFRQRTVGLVAPLEHLIRSGQVKADVLKALAEGREGYSLRNLSVGGWPGQVLTMTASPRAGVIQKDVVACATVPGSEAIVIGLEGLGPPDASDQELVRQMSETVSLVRSRSTGTAARPQGAIELVDEIRVDAPPDFLEAASDDVNELQKHLLFDGARGTGWVAIDLASCVFFADDRDDALVAMLAARDPDWRSGPVKRLGPHGWMVERQADPGAAGGAAAQFPARAYLTAHDDGRALLVVMRGGINERRLFDPAWQAIAASVRFDGSKDLSSLLINGSEAARRVSGGALSGMIPADGATEDWYMWDASANAGQDRWSQLSWRVALGKDGAWESISGTRQTQPSDSYLADARFEQTWSAAADLSSYQITTAREVTRGRNQRSRHTFEQRVTVDRGRMTLAVEVGTSLPDVPVPSQYVPGGIVPLVLRELAEKPALIRTESFTGVETVAPPGLLTLFVTKLADAPVRLDPTGEQMECVTVGVNGTGVVSRWYYSPQHELRFIDFAGGLKAGSGAEK